VAVAYNREPKLLREKMRCLHLCAGAYPPGFLEWNVQLDPHAFVRILAADLPVAIFPCAATRSAFDLGQHNTYWQLPDRGFIRAMHPRLQSYLAFAIDRTARIDFLCAVEEDASEEVLHRVSGGPHHVWETAVWAQVTGRRLVRRSDGSHRLVPSSDVAPEDQVLNESLQPGRVTVQPDGQFRFEPDPHGDKQLYYRENPEAVQAACCDALPALYKSFAVPG
jgi:hypothetical protein